MLGGIFGHQFYSLLLKQRRIKLSKREQTRNRRIEQPRQAGSSPVRCKICTVIGIQAGMMAACSRVVNTRKHNRTCYGCRLANAGQLSYSISHMGCPCGLPDQKNSIRVATELSHIGT